MYQHASRRSGDEALGRRIGLAITESDADEDCGLLLGKYRIEARTSSDDRIQRFDATRVSDGRWVSIELAIKRDAEMEEAFVRRARSECKLRHRHVLAALEWGTGPDERPFLVREAIDTEPLGRLVAREGGLPWKRTRAIALQLCNAVTAAREVGLKPADLSLSTCLRARRDGVVDDIRLDSWVELEALPAGKRDERMDVVSIARLIEQLVAGQSWRGLSESAENTTAPPPQLGEVLARARSIEGTQRYATVMQLGLAIAAIGEGAVPWSRAASAATIETVVPDLWIDVDPDPEPGLHQTIPVEVACVSAAGLPKLVLPKRPVTGANATTRRAARATHWWIVPWFVVAIGVAAGTVHLVAPTFWAGAVAWVRDGIDAIGRGLRAKEPTGVATEMPSLALNEASDAQMTLSAASSLPIPLHATSLPPVTRDAVPELEPIAALPLETPRSMTVPPPPVIRYEGTPVRRPRAVHRKSAARPSSTTPAVATAEMPALIDEDDVIAHESFAEPEKAGEATPNPDAAPRGENPVTAASPGAEHSGATDEITP